MRPEGAPTAEGDLERTPFAHLLLYAADRRLTGALYVIEPSGVEHVVRLVRGAPVKIRPGDDALRLGELLVQRGLVAKSAVEAAAARPGLMGEVLVLSGLVTEAQLEAAVDAQFRERVVRMFAVPPGSRYAFYEGSSELLGWGGPPAVVDPLAMLWMGLRQHPPASARYASTLASLAGVPLCLHPLATVKRFGLKTAEQAVLAVMAAGPSTIEVLVDSGVASEELVQRLVYLLAITRNFELKGSRPPVGTDADPTAGSGLGRIGRITLRSTVHRLGAAAPDAPGDGERGPISPPRRRRRDGDAPASDPGEAAASPRVVSSPDVIVNASGATPADQDPVVTFEIIDDLGGFDVETLRALADDCWERAQRRGADVKALTLELDEVVRHDDASAQARYYRAMLRRRLGDDAGAQRDLERVIEMEPEHAAAARELAALRPRTGTSRAEGDGVPGTNPPGGLFSRIFSSNKR